MWDVLVREAAASELLFDSYFLEKLTNLVIALNWCRSAFDGTSIQGTLNHLQTCTWLCWWT